MHRPLVRPTFTVTTEDRRASITYLDTQPGGHHVVIDVEARSALLNGRTNVRGRLFPADFVGFEVLPETTLHVRLDHDGPATAAGHAAAAWRHAWF